MARNPFFVSHLKGAVNFHKRIAANATTAAAVVVRNQAKRNVRGGFTTGDFVNGNLFNKIEHELVSPVLALVGTTVDYGAYWELGHPNLFTGKYERVQWLKPAMEKTKDKQQEAATKAARKATGKLSVFMPGEND